MFILQIQKNKIEQNKILQIVYLKNEIKKVKRKILLLEKQKDNKISKNLRLLLSKGTSFKSKNLINYIIGISVYNTKTIIHVSDIKGTIKFFCTAGSLGLKRKQTNKQVTVLIKLVKIMMSRTKFISKQDFIALHLKNCNKYLSTFVSSFLAKYYNIEFIRIDNNQPHNGCRPRKIKRKKRRKLDFTRIS